MPTNEFKNTKNIFPKYIYKNMFFLFSMLLVGRVVAFGQICFKGETGQVHLIASKRHFRHTGSRINVDNSVIIFAGLYYSFTRNWYNFVVQNS